MTAQRTERGFSLIELLMSVAIASLVMVGISAAFIAQAQQYQAHSGRRDAQSSARVGLGFIEDRLRLAGYGVNPNLAVQVVDSFDAQSGTRAAATNFPDALIIHHRDLDFSRMIASGGASAGSLTLQTALKSPLRQGQILLALCTSPKEAVNQSDRRYAYVTVGATTTANALTVTLMAPGQANVTLDGAPDDQFRQNVLLDNPCFDTGTAVLVKVERFAFYVNNYDDDGDNGVSTPNVPYLMMHRGLDMNGDGTIAAADAQPLASAVEQLQVSVVLNSAPGQQPQLLGVTDATRIPDLATFDSAATRPMLSDAYTAPIRTQVNPANIRQVRVTLVSRSTSTNTALEGDTVFAQGPTSSGTLGDGTVFWQQMENLTEPVNAVYRPVGGGFVRTVRRVTVSPKNLLMREQFLPHGFGG